MANRERGELRLVAPPHVYTLRLTVGWCCELEDRAGQPFGVITARVHAGRITELRWLLWGALQGYHAEACPSVETAGGLIDVLGVQPIKQALSALLRLNGDDDPPKHVKGQKPVVDDRPGSIWRRMSLDALSIGLTLDQFYALTLLDAWRVRAAARQRAEHDRDRDLRLAWWTEAMARHKQLPNLATLLAQQRSGPQSGPQLLANLEHIADQYGLKVTRRKANT